MVAQAVIKKIALPIHAIFFSNELLPVLDGRSHSRFARERNNRMQMIRHQQAEAAVPDESLVIKFHRGEHSIANGRARHAACSLWRVRAGSRTQLVFAPRHTINGDKEPTALGYPLRNCVRRLFARREIHVSSLTRSSLRVKGTKVGRAVP